MACAGQVLGGTMAGLHRLGDRPQPAPGLLHEHRQPRACQQPLEPGRAPPCLDPTSASDAGCAYDYGWNAAAYAYSVAAAATSPAAAAGHAWWADVRGQRGRRPGRPRLPAVGVYSTWYQWGQITGGYQMGAAP